MVYSTKFICWYRFTKKNFLKKRKKLINQKKKKHLNIFVSKRRKKISSSQLITLTYIRKLKVNEKKKYSFLNYYKFISVNILF